MKSFDIKTKIVFGEGALERLAGIGVDRAFVVADPFVVKGGLIRYITEPLDRAGVR